MRAGTVRPDYESRVLRMYGQWFDVTSTSFTCSLLHHTCQPHPDILHMNVSPPAISPRCRVLKHYNLANDINSGVVSGLGLRIELVSFFLLLSSGSREKMPGGNVRGKVLHQCQPFSSPGQVKQQSRPPWRGCGHTTNAGVGWLDATGAERNNCVA